MACEGRPWYKRNRQTRELKLKGKEEEKVK